MAIVAAISPEQSHCDAGVSHTYELPPAPDAVSNMEKLSLDAEIQLHRSILSTRLKPNKSV